MADLSEGQIRKIDELALKGGKKSRIASALHISRSTVYAKLEMLHPEGDKAGVLKLRTRRTGHYKATAQDLLEIRKFVLANRFCTNREIIKELGLNVKSIVTISKWLKELGIGSYIAATNQFLNAENVEKR